jgi:hypothetical protein
MANELTTIIAAATPCTACMKKRYTGFLLNVNAKRATVEIVKPE